MLNHAQYITIYIFTTSEKFKYYKVFAKIIYPFFVDNMLFFKAKPNGQDTNRFNSYI